MRHPARWLGAAILIGLAAGAAARPAREQGAASTLLTFNPNKPFVLTVDTGGPEWVINNRFKPTCDYTPSGSSTPISWTFAGYTAISTTQVSVFFTPSVGLVVPGKGTPPRVGAGAGAGAGAVTVTVPTTAPSPVIIPSPVVQIGTDPCAPATPG